MFRPTRYAVISAVAALSVLVGMPATASAMTTTLWVGPSASGNGKSCTHPGYGSIQTAITAAATGGTVKVCPGTYREQLSIDKAVTLTTSGTPAATVQLPKPATSSTTACDLARNAVAGGEDQDLVSICTAESVTIKGLAFEAKWPEGTCNDHLYGILVAGGATLNATKVTVNGAGAFPINGCQGGIGIQVGFEHGGQVGHAILSHDTVTNYQKNGMTIDGTGSTATITGTTVTGAGPADQGQNGIQVSRGAQATISKATISDNECDHSLIPRCGPEGEQATGVMFYGAAAGSSVSKSKVSKNDMGVYYVSEGGTEPASPEVAITEDKLIENRYESVQLEQGKATVNNDKITGPGLDGIYLNQYEGQPYAVDASAKEDTIKGMTQAAVYVWSSDLETDIPGTFLIEKSAISKKNEAEVINLNPGKFTVTSKENT